MPPHDEFERSLVGQGFRHVAGVDEAGRGPLAGPVSAAAVILDLDNLPGGIDDSKALTHEQRETACSAILGRAVAVGIGFASAAEIDRINIRQATFVAMRRAVAALSTAPHHLLIDGKDRPSACPCPIQMVIGGDALSLSIAAASIVAKVMRDRLMVRLHAVHPDYGFATHKGYATAAHRAALRRHGPSPFHRLSFSSASYRVVNGESGE